MWPIILSTASIWRWQPQCTHSWSQATWPASSWPLTPRATTASRATTCHTHHHTPTRPTVETFYVVLLIIQCFHIQQLILSQVTHVIMLASEVSNKTYISKWFRQDFLHFTWSPAWFQCDQMISKTLIALNNLDALHLYASLECIFWLLYNHRVGIDMFYLHVSTLYVCWDK